MLAEEIALAALGIGYQLVCKYWDHVLRITSAFYFQQLPSVSANTVKKGIGTAVAVGGDRTYSFAFVPDSSSVVCSSVMPATMTMRSSLLWLT